MRTRCRSGACVASAPRRKGAALSRISVRRPDSRTPRPTQTCGTTPVSAPWTPSLNVPRGRAGASAPSLPLEGGGDGWLPRRRMAAEPRIGAAWQLAFSNRLPGTVSIPPARAADDCRDVTAAQAHIAQLHVGGGVQRLRRGRCTALVRPVGITIPHNATKAGKPAAWLKCPIVGSYSPHNIPPRR
jgi:hypothetical protein